MAPVPAPTHTLDTTSTHFVITPSLVYSFLALSLTLSVLLTLGAWIYVRGRVSRYARQDVEAKAVTVSSFPIDARICLPGFASPNKSPENPGTKPLALAVTVIVDSPRSEPSLLQKCLPFWRPDKGMSRQVDMVTGSTSATRVGDTSEKQTDCNALPAPSADTVSVSDTTTSCESDTVVSSLHDHSKPFRKPTECFRALPECLDFLSSDVQAVIFTIGDSDDDLITTEDEDMPPPPIIIVDADADKLVSASPSYTASASLPPGLAASRSLVLFPVDYLQVPAMTWNALDTEEEYDGGAEDFVLV